MRALSIRQPFAELILRGLKTVEYRTRPTRIIGERFFIYASKGGKWNDEVRRMNDELRTAEHRPVTSDNLSVEPPPPWMLALAEALRILPADLPRGVIVGSAVIEKCEEISDQMSEVRNGEALNSDLRPLTSMYAWHLGDIERARTLRKPRSHPQPVWFQPF